MKLKTIIITSLLAIFMGGCATQPPYMDKEKKTVSKNYSFANGTVIANFGSDVVIEINDYINIVQ